MSTRRKSRNNKPGRVMLDSQSVRQLQVYRYPFSTATSNPKIPDGKITQSTGMRLQAVRGDLEGEELFIVLFPGLHSHCAIIKGTTVEYMSWSTGIKSTSTELTTKGALTNPGPWAQWRLVSKALRLKCITNDDQNDGFFEAVRFPITEVEKGTFIHAKSTASTVGGNTVETPKIFHTSIAFRILDEIKKQQNWLLNPSYQSGKIKNLGQYEFRLQPQKNEHDLIGIPHTVEWGADEFSKDGEKTDDGIDLAHSFKYTLDPQFDCICIRLKGVTNSKYLIHCVDNVEVTIGPGHPEAIYQTECVDSEYGLKKRQLEFKKEERLPGKFIGGPRNS